MNIEECTSMDDFSSYIEINDIVHPKLFLHAKLKSGDRQIVINHESILNKFMNNILDTCITYELEEGEMMEYIYQPKLFAYEKLNNIELWSLILKLNNMTSVLDFKKEELIVPTESTIDMLNEIMIIMEDDIVNNDELVNG